jgi:hypothetical protein
MSIGSRLIGIDRRYVFLVLALVTVVPLISPLGLPIPISDASRDFYEGLDAIPDGSVVVMDWELRFGRPVWATLLTDVFKHLLSKDVFIIHVSFDRSLEGGEQCEMSITRVNPEKNFGKQYGVDYVNLGAVAGQIAALQGFVRDSWTQYPTDNRGTLVQNIPIMDKMRSGADIDYVVSIGSGTPEWWIGQLQVEYGTPIYALADAGEATAITPFVESGQIAALLTDMRGAAEYELLIGMPGEAIKSMDPINTIHITEAALLVVTNVIFFMQKGKEEGGS